MGLFYKVPSDLKQLESMVLAVAGQMASVGRIDTAVAVMNDMLPDTIDFMHTATVRLRASGRDQDLKALRKHLLSVGKFMDNAPYNRMYRPFILEHLGG